MESKFLENNWENNGDCITVIWVVYILKLTILLNGKQPRQCQQVFRGVQK